MWPLKIGAPALGSQLRKEKPGFIGAQLLGLALAVGLVSYLWPSKSSAESK